MVARDNFGEIVGTNWLEAMPYPKSQLSIFDVPAVENLSVAIRMPKVELVPIYTRKYPPLKIFLIWLTKRRQFMLTKDYCLWSNQFQCYLKAPCHFVMDFASVPKFLHPVFNPTGLLAIAAIFHDMLYRFKNLIVYREGWERCKLLFPEGVVPGRKISDKIFLEIGQQVTGSFILNGAAYSTLRICGAPNYRKSMNIIDQDWSKPVFELKYDGPREWPGMA
jgi:hypothetical protein